MSEESPESRAAASAETDEDVGSEQDDGNAADDAVDEEDARENGVVEEGEAAASEATADDASDLAARVAEHDEDLAAEVEGLQSRLADAEAEIDEREERIEELEGALKRSKADFKNYKKRAKKREEEIRERATEDFVGRVVSVRDNLVRALDQDEGADIRPGIESTLEEFDRILEEENVTPIDPDPGEDVDPTRHEVLMRVDDSQPEGAVVDVYRPGYEMAGAVIREAQVTVSTGAGDESDGENAEESGESDE
ncbi:nucleotide exchange factor GrpE [Halobellus ordinarius]|uniref:nucleotide exchange factor GrpE n=1 Tax=Halobellus ordinarius TaxID=3075120 RepID=UPI00288025CC|nr:nucleotide exchange factor GrpE [Halobellus sp. ZY16]